MSRKRDLTTSQDEKTECYSLSKKIKNFHLNSVANLTIHNGEESKLVNQVNLSNQTNHLNQLQSSSSMANEQDELNQRLSEQIVNYSNSIINNVYSPDTGGNENYVKINKVLFEANKMRILRNQVRLLNQSQ